MAQRPLLRADRWVALLGVPTDEEMLIQHYTLTQTELGLVQEKTAAYNQLGLALQLCLIRHLGRSWQYEELLPAPVVAFVAEQIDVQTTMLAEYGRRSQTRREHAIEAQRHLGLHPAGREDRRAALLAAITTAAATDQGKPIAEAVIAAFRERHSLLPAAGTLDRIGRAGRAVARKRMEASLLDGLTSEKLATFDGLLIIDPVIRQTRFAWLRALPEAPSEKNLLGLIERLSFVRASTLIRSAAHASIRTVGTSWCVRAW
jgi:hypothetical protein